jgi:cytohesin
MKHLLLTTIAAVVLVGCGPSASDISIHNAAAGGHIKAIKQHLDAGTDVNKKRSGGSTPLHPAAYRGHKEIVELLLAEGADVNAKQDSGRTPLDLAIKHKRTEIADLLRKHGGTSGAADSIHVAAAMGNIEAVKQHLAAGTDVDARDKQHDKTPLQHAAYWGHKELAELLIAKGADVNAKEVYGNTPLDWANPEMRDLLRKHGGKRGAELKAAGN